jgi:hypothetical protein
LPGGALLAGPTTSCPYNPVSDHRHAPPYVQKSFLARQLLYSFRELHYLRQCNPVAPARSSVAPFRCKRAFLPQNGAAHFAKTNNNAAKSLH